MKRLRVVVASLVFAVVATSLLAGPPLGEGRVLYKVRKGARAAQLEALDAVVKGRGLAAVRRLKGLGVDVARLPQGQVTEEALCAELLATGAVAYAEPDRLVAPVAIPNDPSYGNQWQHTRINSPGAWDTTTGSASVLAAVCDTGVSSAHPDLAANLQLPGYNSVDGTTNTEPVYNHGTGVAGCIGAVGNNAVGVAGVAWTVKILPIRITNTADGRAFVSDAVDGIRYAADHGAKVANLSYLMAGYSAIADAGQYLRDRGGLLFVAAGNDNQDPGWTDFASFVCVGATTSSDTRASFSNYGVYIDVVAPGVSVYSTSGAASYAYMSGTSFSSPITAGLGALLYAVNPSFTPAEVESFIFSTCVDLGDPGEDNLFGHGRIDAAAAVAKAANVQPNQPPVAAATAAPTSGTAPLDVTFDGSGSSDPDGTLVAYQWSFGDGSSASGASVAHTYTAQGTYTATLTVTDDRGATDTDSVQIVVEQDPTKLIYVADIAMALATAPGGLVAEATVTILDLGGNPRPGAVVAGTWTGPKTSTVSGTTGADGTVTLTSLKAKGTFTYTFTVTDVAATGYTYDPGLNVETSDSISSGETPNQPPKANIVAAPTSGPAPLTVDFDGTGSSDPDGQVVAYAWSFGDGTSGTGATAQHVYQSDGTYTATLTVTDDKGATGTAQVAIVVSSEPRGFLHVQSISLALVDVPGGTEVEARVAIVDAAGQSVAGAAVTGEWSGLVAGASTATTGADGIAVLTSRKTKKSGTITLTVTGVSAPGYTYDPTQNVETSKSITR